MNERTFLLQTRNVSENASDENSNSHGDLTAREASLQKSEVHELQILLDKAQTLLENQPDENSAAKAS